jgi:hypothetical protein
MEDGCVGLNWRAAARALVVLGAGIAASAPAMAVELFKCGSTFQDRPCAEAAVQQRFSRTQGAFSIEQVNPDTDKDCARVARDAMPWWERLARGDSLEAVKADIQAHRMSRADKGQMHDVLVALREVRGEPLQVRGQFESQCMAYKRRNGFPSEREVATGAAALASEGPAPTRTEQRGYAATDWAAEAAAMRAQAAAMRAQAEAARASRRRD